MKHSREKSHQEACILSRQITIRQHNWRACIYPPNFDAGDVRGLCPGLNAAANHGYIPHNGVGTIGDFISGTNEAYGMSLDLGGFLAVYGAVFDGNLLGYSIGGPTQNSELPLNNILGALGAPQGLSGSHNKYEADISPTCGDLYVS